MRLYFTHALTVILASPLLHLSTRTSPNYTINPSTTLPFSWLTIPLMLPVKSCSLLPSILITTFSQSSMYLLLASCTSVWKHHHFILQSNSCMGVAAQRKKIVALTSVPTQVDQPDYNTSIHTSTPYSIASIPPNLLPTSQMTRGLLLIPSRYSAPPQLTMRTGPLLPPLPSSPCTITLLSTCSLIIHCRYLYSAKL